MNTRTRLSLLGSVGLLVLLVPALAEQEADRPGDELALSGFEVFQVKLDRPFTTTDARGVERTFEEAFLVRLQVSHPGFWGEKVDFYVGDFRVPEYGGWAEGIYFKVYDPELFRSLLGGEIRYRIGSYEMRSFERVLEVEGLEALKLRPESDVLRGVEPKPDDS